MSDSNKRYIAKYDEVFEHYYPVDTKTDQILELTLNVQRLNELDQENQQLKQRISVLDKERDEIKASRDMYLETFQVLVETLGIDTDETYNDEFKPSQVFLAYIGLRDIEQQIKALDKLEDGLTWSSDMGCLVVTSEYIADRMEQLRKGGECD